jgi:hypothetical protein
MDETPWIWVYAVAIVRGKCSLYEIGCFAAVHSKHKIAAERDEITIGEIMTVMIRFLDERKSALPFQA